MAYRKTEETDFSLTSYGLNGGPVHREGCGITQNGTPRAIVPPLSTASLQPPRATVHPPSTSSSLHLLLFIHRVFLLPPPATVHPWATVHPASTGYCSTSPPQAAIHLALHWLRFNQPSMGSCSSTPNRLDRGHVHPAATTSTTTGSCSSNPHRELFIQTRNNTHYSSRGSIDRLQLEQ